MEELRAVLRDHARRYPRMESTDAVKLIYQNEFGGGHMIRDTQACLDFLHREYAGVNKDPAAILREDIGNGIVRVHLAALSAGELDELGQEFIRSASCHRGSMDRFLAKLEVLRDLTGQGVFSFGSRELEAYLSEYEKAGYPAVSHSESYRRAYHPAYRIVRK